MLWTAEITLKFMGMEARDQDEAHAKMIEAFERVARQFIDDHNGSLEIRVENTHPFTPADILETAERAKAALSDPFAEVKAMSFSGPAGEDLEDIKDLDSLIGKLKAAGYTSRASASPEEKAARSPAGMAQYVHMIDQVGREEIVQGRYDPSVDPFLGCLPAEFRQVALIP